MKSTSGMTRTFVRNIAFTALCLGLATTSFAASKKPLSYPKGLAVDAKGNLYLANSGGNDILVYNPNYVQLPKSTITSNISNPSAVAIDAQGNLWVANYGTSNGGPEGSIAEYTAGVQNTAGTITTLIIGPEAMAVDGAGNVWVENDNSNINVYNPPALYTAGIGWAGRSFTPNYPITGLTVQNGTIAWGTKGAVNFASSTLGLVNGSLNYLGYGNDDGGALVTDATGAIYMCNSDGTVNIAIPVGEYNFTTLPFPAAGAAIDNVRHRIYFSNANGNSIAVYSTTSAALLATIK